jgi:hypothetical protein
MSRGAGAPLCGDATASDFRGRRQRNAKTRVDRLEAAV